MSDLAFKVDAYSAARGGESKELLLHCAACSGLLFAYQKDGPGILKRSYLDRIRSAFSGFDEQGFLHCPHCDATLGFSEPYAKEQNRPAVRWAVGALLDSFSP